MFDRAVGPEIGRNWSVRGDPTTNCALLTNEDSKASLLDQDLICIPGD